MMVLVRASIGTLHAIDAHCITSIETKTASDGAPAYVEVCFEEAGESKGFHTREPIADLVRRINVARSGNAFVAGPPEDVVS